jgi:hypothetical protein
VEVPESSGGISVTGATVGQTVKIAEVDENGVPTAWEPTDFPSGGGSGGEGWILLHTMTLAEDTKFFSYELGRNYDNILIAFKNLWCVEGTSTGIAVTVNDWTTSSVVNSVHIGNFINKKGVPAIGVVELNRLSSYVRATVTGVNSSGYGGGSGVGIIPHEVSDGISKIIVSLPSYASKTMNAGAEFNIYVR